MTTIAIYNAELNAAPSFKDGITPISLQSLMYKETGKDGVVRERCALAVRGAVHQDDGSIQVSVRIDLFHALGMAYENGNHKHAKAAINIRESDFEAGIWKSLSNYATRMIGQEFKSGEVVLTTGSGAYFLSPALPQADSFIVFDLMQEEDVEINGSLWESYAIDNFWMGNGASFVAPVGELKKGNVTRRETPFSGSTEVQAVASAPVTRRPVAIPASLGGRK
ncbi:hypothetical protein OsccyDRAFT_0656 [Leptolyngbyaceae cyanobacterium JSC-12]|nr:hypothetical protein OsccyDRAFT_0656 [Leptolyngbyaceae cyanobacterium JSC-12]